MADKIAGYVLPIVGIVLAVLPVKEWLKRFLPFLWPDYWGNSSTVDSSTPSADSEDANRKTGSDAREDWDWYPYGPADVKELYTLIGRNQYLEGAYGRLLEENERLRNMAKVTKPLEWSWDSKIPICVIHCLVMWHPSK